MDFGKAKGFPLCAPLFRWIFTLFLFWIGLAAYAQTRELIHQLDSISRMPADSAQTEALFNCFSEVYQFVQSKEKSQTLLPYARKMLVDAKVSNDPHRIALAQQALAYLYSRTKDYPASFRYSTLAMAEWKKEKYWKGIAELMFHDAYLQMNNGDEARIIPACREALKLCADKGLSETEVQIKSWLGGYFLRIGQYDSAIVFSLAGLNRPEVSMRRKVFNTFDIGNCYLMKNDSKQAETYYRKTLEICRQQNYDNLLGIVLSSIANVKYKEGQFGESEKLMLDCLPFIPKMERLDFRMNVYGMLMDIYEAQKDYPNYYKWAKIYQVYVDSVNTQNNQKEYRELEEKYQAKLKDRTIKEKDEKLHEEVLRRQWLIAGIFSLTVISILSAVLFFVNRKRKESQLEQARAESEMKALRAQMNPHFMFNSLNAIQQMVLANENDGAFEYLDTYSKLTRQILENSEKKWIPLKDEIRFLELYLKMESLRFDHPFQWKIELDDGISPHSDKIPAMLIQPLVENAIKHGLLPKKGEKMLWIRFRRDYDDSPIVVEVEDNGVGRQPATERREKSDHHSMSLTITENRLKLLGNGKSTGLQILDLTDANGQPAGTKVRFLVSD